MLQNFQNMKLRVTIQLKLILREINFYKIWTSKIAFVTIFETPNFEFWYIWDLRNGSDSQNSVYDTNGTFEPNFRCTKQISKTN